MLKNDNGDLFTKDDWVRFFRWKDEYLLQVFPEASIRISRHPAEFTDRDAIAEIAEELGVEVPERYQSENQ